MSKKLQELFPTSHPEWTPVMEGRRQRLLGKAYELAIELNPSDTREKSVALTKLEECVMWAIKGIENE